MGKKSKSKNRRKSSPKEEEELPSSFRERFDASKPQFRKPKEESSKVVIDERFASVLTDPRFQLDVKDKYGRKKKKKEVTEELSAFYKVQREDKDGEQSGSEDESKASQTESEEESSSDSEEQDSEKEGEDEDPVSRIAYLTALSRGELDVSSSSDEDEVDDEHSQSSSDDDSSDGSEDPVLGKAGILDPSAKENDEVEELVTESTPYLAVTNMDWEHVRAVDIFAILASFTPPGAVKRVQVYPSDFGLERMKAEERFGPKGLWKKKKRGSLESGDGNDDPIDDRGSADDDSVDSAEGDSIEGAEDDNEEAGLRIEAVEVNGINIEVGDAESDFDPEKLRAYEASKLKYYFAIVEFSTSKHADVAYKEVDGMEFEHSSAALDLRAVMPADLEGITKDRPLRDEAASIPSNYVPPEFVVSALQQTNVECSWEIGDTERERRLTKYGTGQTWEQIAESDDLRAYLASDASSCEGDDDEENGKAARMRKMLGLDSDEENDSDKGPESSSDAESSASESEGEEFSKEVRFVPGTKSLEDKIRSKIESNDAQREITPWEKYQEKRKQKRREKRQAAREKRKEVNELRKSGASMEPPSRSTQARARDEFFVSDNGDPHNLEEEDIMPGRQTREALELLVAGDEGEDEMRDYDMRGLQRIERNKNKKLRGSRKRKEAELAANVSGTDFNVDVEDDRFKALLDGSDDRFGIDRTDSNYKETSAMREILAEQTRRRKAKRRKNSKPGDNKADKIAPDVSADSNKPTPGASALSALVGRLKFKVQQ